MFEVYVLVQRKKSIGLRLLACVFLAFGIVAVLMSCLMYTMLAVSVVFFGIWFYLQFRSNKEFEYSYFDGEVRFAKIINKSRRKRLKVFPMEEVEIIAPSGAHEIYKYENDASMKKIDYTSGTKDMPYYVMIRRNGENTELIQFEPDDKYLDAVCVKYGQKLIRRGN